MLDYNNHFEQDLLTCIVEDFGSPTLKFVLDVCLYKIKGLSILSSPDGWEGKIFVWIMHTLYTHG